MAKKKEELKQMKSDIKALNDGTASAPTSAHTMPPASTMPPPSPMPNMGAGPQGTSPGYPGLGGTYPAAGMDSSTSIFSQGQGLQSQGQGPPGPSFQQQGVHSYLKIPGQQTANTYGMRLDLNPQVYLGGPVDSRSPVKYRRTIDFLPRHAQ